MSGKDQYEKAVFHRAVARAFRIWATEPWELQPDEEKRWSATARMCSGTLQRGIQLTLRNEQHWIEVVVFVSRSAVSVENLPWWEDRLKAINAPGYRGVIWNGAVRYGHETLLCVPKGTSEDALALILAEFLVEIHSAVATWFSQTEAVLSGFEDNRDDTH